ncbi:MAG: DNA/RNA nuclease SfsA [Azospirillaceae bacterium]
MRFPTPLIEGTLVQRYKRFLADIRLADGGVVTAHCANPGGMIGLKDPGLTCFLSYNDVPSRKLKHSLEVVRLANGTHVGINTGHPNRLVEEAIGDGTIAELAGYASLRREVKYGRASRIDLLLEDDHRPRCYVEVKNVHLTRPDGPYPTAAEFPDAVTARGAKHLDELSEMVRQGHRSVMVYLVQRGDNDHFRIAGDIDPAYQAALGRALAAGVEALVYACHVSPEAIVVEKRLPMVL